MDGFNAPVRGLNNSYDNGYLLIGWITPNYPPYCWIIKTDINGVILYQKLIGGINNSTMAIANFSQNLVGELYLCGSTTSEDDSNPIIMKLNVCGEKEWCREISTTSENDYFCDIINTTDNGCAALIYGALEPLYPNGAGCMKFSSSGDLQWQQYYQSEDPGVSSVIMSDLILAPDNGFLMTGFCYYLDPDNPNLYWLHPYYIKADSLGNFEWETVVHKETGDIGGQAFMSLANPLETYYYSCISLYYTSDTLFTTRPAIVKLDLQGNVIGIYDLVQGNYDLGKIMTFDFLSDSLLVGSAGWGDEDGPYQSRAIIFDTLGHITDSATIADDYFLGFTKVAFDDKILILKSNLEVDDLDPTLFKLTKSLEQDTFYTRPFVYDSLCPYQIASDTIVPDDCGVIVGVEEETRRPGDREIGGQERLEIWPNPASDIVRVSYFNHQKVGQLASWQLDKNIIEIYNVFGREVHSEIVSSPPAGGGGREGGRLDWTVDVSAFPPGIYFLSVVLEGKHIAGSKFVVVH